MFTTIVSSPFVLNAIALFVGLIIAISIVAIFELFKYKKISKMSMYSVAIFTAAAVCFGVFGVHHDESNDPTSIERNEKSNGDVYLSVNFDRNSLEKDIQEITLVENIAFTDTDDKVLFNKLKNGEEAEFTGKYRGHDVEGTIFYSEDLLTIKERIVGTKEYTILNEKVE